jgi:uncharacterized MAPEG superfamily protein
LRFTNPPAGDETGGTRKDGGMSTELMLLVWSVGLAILQMLVAFVMTTLDFGVPDMPGGREKLPPPDSFAGRAQRASQNMLESLVPFAVLILATEVSNRVNASSELGAEVFFASRVIYAAVAMAGLPWLRTGVWCVSILAMLLVLAQLV